MGYFSWSVPMVAYMIASGSSYAVTSVVGGMDSAISKNASVKGADAGLGNMTSGQVRDNNYLGNKWDVTHTQNTGSKAPNFNATGLQGAHSTNSVGFAGGQQEAWSQGGNKYMKYTDGASSEILESANGGKSWEVTQATGAFKMQIGKTYEGQVADQYNKAYEQKLADTKSVKTDESALHSAIVNNDASTATTSGGDISGNKDYNDSKSANKKTSATNKKAATNESSAVVKGTVGAGLPKSFSPVRAGIQIVTTAGTKSADSNADTHALEHIRKNQTQGNIIKGHSAQWYEKNGKTASIRNDAAKLVQAENNLSKADSNVSQLSNKLSSIKSQMASGGLNLAPDYLNSITTNGSLTNQESNFHHLVTDAGNGELPKSAMSFIKSKSDYTKTKNAVNSAGSVAKNAAKGLNPSVVNRDFAQAENKYRNLFDANSGSYNVLKGNSQGAYSEFLTSSNNAIYDLKHPYNSSEFTRALTNDYYSLKNDKTGIDAYRQWAKTTNNSHDLLTANHTEDRSNLNDTTLIKDINSYNPKSLKFTRPVESEIERSVVKNHIHIGNIPTAAPYPVNPIFNK
jgi:hypothetical protein